MAAFKKDPDAVLDYTVNWSDWLTPIADTIVTSTWVPDTSLTVVSSSHSASSATAFVSGGVLDTEVLLTNRITTAGGRTDDRSITLKIVSR